MDRRREVRQFLTSRRARLSPEAAGVTVRGHERRVPGLRREEVAHGGAREDAADVEAIPSSLQRLLDAIAAPAFVRNRRLDYLAANDLGRALFCEVFDTPGPHPNQARYVFLDPRAKRFHPDWAPVAGDLAAMLRLESARTPGDRELTVLVEQLLAESAEFRSRWESGDVRLSQAGSPKHFRHPVAGDLHLTVDSMQVHTRGDLTFWAATAEPGSPSAAGLARLLSPEGV